MKAILETLATGDELLTGKIADTNSQFVASRLFAEGMRLDRQTVIGDDEAQLLAQIDRAAREASAVICFGGLGPTSDDKTVDCVAKRLGCGVTVHPESHARMIARYREFKREVTLQAERQVRYPNAAEPMLNPVGAAPGFAATIGQCRFYFLPGVPEEMRGLFDQSVMPDLKARLGQTTLVRNHVWRLLGVPESEVQRQLDPVEAELPKNAWVGYRTSYPENHVILYWRAENGEALVPESWVARQQRRAA